MTFDGEDVVVTFHVPTRTIVWPRVYHAVVVVCYYYHPRWWKETQTSHDVTTTGGSALKAVEAVGVLLAGFFKLLVPFGIMLYDE